jgi:hypothetical protein
MEIMKKRYAFNAEKKGERCFSNAAEFSGSPD